MNLEYPQREWLSKLIHHPNRKRWVTDSEIDMITIVLGHGSYGEDVKIRLQSIRDYYIRHSSWKGTLDNPQ